MSPLTKMLIVLNMVFSLALSVAIVLMVSKQENYKAAADSATAARVAAGAMLNNVQQQIAAANAARDSAQGNVDKLTNQLNQVRSDAIAAQAKADSEQIAANGKNAQLSAQVAALTTANATAMQQIAAKDAELADLRPKVSDLTTKYNALYQAKNESDNQLRASEQAIRKLQEQLQAALSAPAANGTGGGASAMISGPGTEGQVQVLSNSASAAGPINAKVGKIGQVSGMTLFEVPLGTRDGMKPGTKLFIYRGNAYIGDAEITGHPTPDVSVAKVTSTKSGESVKEGDMVSTISQ